MKSKLQILSSVSLVALLGSCATQIDEPTPIVTTPEFEYKTQQVESQSSIIPDWFKQLPEEDDIIFSSGTATAPDLQLSVDIATLNAKYTLADRINGKLDGMMKSFISRLGQDDDVSATTITEVDKVIKNVIASVDVAGYNPSKLKIYPDGTQYRAFVLLEYSDKEAQKIIFNRLRKDRLVYSRIRSTKAWEELESAVDKAEEKDEIQSLQNLEKIIKPKVTRETPST